MLEVGPTPRDPDITVQEHGLRYHHALRKGLVQNNLDAHERIT